MPFHEGELAVQRRAGVSHIAAKTGKIVADRILPLALPFLAQQRMLVLGTRAPDGRMWASLLFGERGFARSEDSVHVRINLDRASIDQADPLWNNLGGQAGMLLIDFDTRRRYRINGPLRQSGHELILAVAEAYANCPQYIQPITASADRFFVATAHPERGADVSHRGGPRGFVQVEPQGTLLIPDYQGNGMFNTLGNLAANPHAGLIFPDFVAGSAVQLSGTAEILWDEPERAWRFHIDEQRTFALPSGVTQSLDRMKPNG